ncbi:MAG: aminoglycoside phosphotransferase family protein [Candidatus Competibacteraceae bacterium]|nr:aminoglycoside phosphotransferase family protein [Candidatus Competibacteraceae bacterium]
MLSNPDRQVVAREPALPGMALLLDNDHALGVLQARWPDQRIERLTTGYLKYKPGTSCLVGYLADTSDGPLPLHARAYTARQYAKIRAAEAEEIRSAYCRLDDQFTAFWRFPVDRKVAGLAGLASPEARARLLRDLLPDEPEWWAARLETLRYKPERRYVGKLTVDDRPKAIIKVYDEADFRNAWRAARTVETFATRERLAVSAPLGCSNEQRIIVSQWLAGEPLSELLPDCSAHRLREVGAALAEFHRQAPGYLVQVAREDEAMAVLAAANAAAWLCPDLAPRLRGLATRIAAELLAEPVEQCPIHGDFSADQVLVAAQGIGIIDYDQTRVGDPAADFGTFIARLEYSHLSGGLPEGRVGEIADALGDGYCHQARCAQPSQTDLYVAAGLLRLAPHSFRTRHADWPTHIEQVAQRAERRFRDHSRHRQAVHQVAGRSIDR